MNEVIQGLQFFANSLIQKDEQIKQLQNQLAAATKPQEPAKQ